MTITRPAPTGTTRDETSREILAAFDLAPGATVSGVAAGGRFVAAPSGPLLDTYDPTTGAVIARVRTASESDYAAASAAARAAFERWRVIPAPRRGEFVRLLGERFRARKEELARLITLENGKILSEARGEVQEVIDMCDFAVGLSRQLYGKTIVSERPQHRIVENWHPAGVVGIISAFNFPVAVPGWGWALALVCGDAVLWKPSSLTPLVSVACQQIFHDVTNGTEAEGVFSLVNGGGATVGEMLLRDPRVPVVQATGSCALGERVTSAVGKRGARAILELGGNNALVVLDDADLDQALASAVFGSVGTAAQRCTTTRRLVLQRGIAKTFVERMLAAYRTVQIGDPLDDRTLMGPLISAQAVRDYREGIAEIRRQGGEVLCGDRVLEDRAGYFVAPTIVRSRPDMPVVNDEIFAPILHVFEVDTLDEAIALNNAVPQGLSSGIFTRDLLAAERWLSAVGSDTGIANVNAGTSGAEIGGAFGGEKLTGGGRQAGSDAWKAYMRRQTSAVNYGTQVVLAQGVKFDVEEES